MGGDRIPGPLDSIQDLEAELERIQKQYSADFGHLDKVARAVLYSSRGHFVRLFVQAWLAASADNKTLLKPVFMILIDRYGLEAELKKEGPS